jgi:enoyl-CoA hydratase/carnithine racemase
VGSQVNKAVFGFTEVKLGLIPAVISPFVMMKIGKGNCSRYFLTGTPPHPSLYSLSNFQRLHRSAEA